MTNTSSTFAALLALTTMACATDPAPKDSNDAAAGNDVVAETTPTEPIPAEPAPTEPTMTAPSPITSPITAPPIERPKVEPIQVTIFNRFLIKPTDKGMPESEIKRVVEDTVGAKVTTLRRTAVGYWLVQLAPSEPPRNADAQKAVIAQLQKAGPFAVVEGDQIMTIK